MKDLLMKLKKAFLAFGIITVGVLLYTAYGACEEGVTLHFRSDGLASNLNNDHSDVGLSIPLSRSIFLDFRLSAVETGQSPAGENPSSAPPIPIPKAPGSDLRYGRLGVGLSFSF